jgi:D-alanyl-D-alanine carboxypeptidase/D-alanyl-D-alanine-endopeptidase (penicillin-binding protein 4)
VRGSAHRGGAGARLRRWLAAGLLFALAVIGITLAGFGSFSRTSKHDDQVNTRSSILGPSAAKRPTHKPSAGPNSDPGPQAPQTPAELRLEMVLDKAFRAAGRQSGAFVYDLDSNDRLFSLREDHKRPPASVEKLYTTVALMRILGPDARLHTAVLGTGRLVHGVWHGNLYLRGGGDPTFGDSGFNRVWEQGNGPTAAQLVDQLQHQGIRRVTGLVYGDESLFDRRRGGLMTNYAPDTPDFGGQLSALDYDHGSDTNRLSPARFAVKEFVLTMNGGHIAAKAAKHTSTAPSRARLLAIVNSPPMSVMTRLMDVPSDDLFAELFTKQLGVLFGSGGTISAGARVIRSTIAASYGLHPTILDGSGLSRNDGSSPLEIVDLLRDVWRTTVGGELAASLPTVGKNGTVQGIGLKTPAVGNCIAKTGTLDYVTNLAGYCRSRSGHTLAFALLIDGPPNYAAIVLESRMIGAIARY